jgi:hypothetical protein
MLEKNCYALVKLARGILFAILGSRFAHFPLSLSTSRVCTTYAITCNDRLVETR